MMAVRAGARHATLAQRWLYLSLAAHEASRDAGFDATQVRQTAAHTLGTQIDNVRCQKRRYGVRGIGAGRSRHRVHSMCWRCLQVTVLYKRPTDLALREDVPVVCNLLLADIMDDGEGQTPERHHPRDLTGLNSVVPTTPSKPGDSQCGPAHECIDARSFAAGLLTSGLIPAVRHSLLHLLTADARVLPAAATVFMQVPARRQPRKVIWC